MYRQSYGHRWFAHRGDPLEVLILSMYQYQYQLVVDMIHNTKRVSWWFREWFNHLRSSLCYWVCNPSPAWQVQFTRSEEIGIVIITMQHRLGIKRNALYSTEVQHPFPLVRATLVHFYFYACCPSFRSPVLFCIVLKKGLSKFSNSTPDPWLPAATTYESPSQSQSRLMLSS